MNQHDQLYRLYDEFETDQLREYQKFVDLFPPIDSRVALEHWQNATEELDDGKDKIRDAFPTTGETCAEIAAKATVRRRLQHWISTKNTGEPSMHSC